jgi:uncharacterized protein
MNCPKCIGKLSEKEIVRSIHADVCFLCEGIWLDKGEFGSLIRLDSKDFLFDDLSSSEYDGSEIKELAQELNDKEGHCPRCSNVTLTKSKYRGKKGDLMIDECPQCHGIWLDGGEIHQVRDRGLVDFIKRLSMLKLYSPFIAKMAKQDKENRKKDLRKKP